MTADRQDIVERADEATLLPCPFCGAIPALNEWDDWDGRVQVCCENEDCPVGGVYTPCDRGMVRERAIAAWNTRDGVGGITSLRAERDTLFKEAETLRAVTQLCCNNQANKDERDTLRAELAAKDADAVELVRYLKLIEHATSDDVHPEDGGYHENAHTLAKQALSKHKWGVV